VRDSDQADKRYRQNSPASKQLGAKTARRQNNLAPNRRRQNGGAKYSLSQNSAQTTVTSTR